MIRSLQVAFLFASGALLLPGQPVSFREKVYPILEKAGCRNCHNVEGVASATRLHFPIEDADIARSRPSANRWWNWSTGRIRQILSSF